MVRSVPIAVVKAELSHWVDEVASGSSVLITRHGKPAAALVPADRMLDLERLRASGPAAGLASLAGKWDDAQDFADALDQIVADRRRRPRPSTG